MSLHIKKFPQTALCLKKTSGKSNKKKNRSKNCKASPKSQIIEVPDVELQQNIYVSQGDDSLNTLTASEKAHRLVQLKREKKKIDSKLKLTHRQRIEEFNKQLQRLPEHFDIPKVGPG